MIIGEGIGIPEFIARRDALLKSLDGAIGLVFSGDQSPSLHGPYVPDPNFYYLTGIRDEPGAVLLLDPRAEDPKRRTVLFLKPLNPELEEWDGYRDRVSTALKKQTGFESVMRTYHLPRFLTTIARKRSRLACLHPFAIYDAPASPDLVIFRKLAERCLGLQIKDRTNILPSMRAIKSRAEQRVMIKAAEATAVGYQAAARTIRPGKSERDIQRALEAAFADAGGSGTGYNSIVGCGINSTVLHYNKNNQPLKDGDLLLIDAAARVGGYTADVTRTFPVSGRFTREQREIYTVVLEALEAATRAVRPGRHMHEIDAVARRIIEKAGYGDAFMHGIGHQLGIDVHDATPDGPLKAGMIVTIEPGIYLPGRCIGIRLEDDILVTPRGPKNLTAMIPRRPEQVEAMMRRRR